MHVYYVFGGDQMLGCDTMCPHVYQISSVWSNTAAYTSLASNKTLSVGQAGHSRIDCVLAMAFLIVKHLFQVAPELHAV